VFLNVKKGNGTMNEQPVMTIAAELEGYAVEAISEAIQLNAIEEILGEILLEDDIVNEFITPIFEG
jgi:hypothetical protein